MYFLTLERSEIRTNYNIFKFQYNDFLDVTDHALLLCCAIRYVILISFTYLHFFRFVRSFKLSMIRLDYILHLDLTATETVVTCKIKHLQQCFRAADFPRLCRGRKNVVKMFYFTCNHVLCSTCVDEFFANVLQMFYFTCNHGLNDCQGFAKKTQQ